MLHCGSSLQPTVPVRKSWALQRLQFLQGISTCSSVGSCTGEAAERTSACPLHGTSCFTTVFPMGCRGISALCLEHPPSFFSSPGVHRTVSRTSFFIPHCSLVILPFLKCLFTEAAPALLTGSPQSCSRSAVDTAGTICV